MDAKQIAERHVIELYLAGRLSDEDSRAFEAYVEAHPEIIRDIEVVARMKSGLGTLRDRGELSKLLKLPPKRLQPRPMVIAASIAGLLAVSLLVLQPWRATSDVKAIASTMQGLVSEGRDPPPIGASISLARTRSAKPSEIQRPPKETAVQITLQLFANDAGGPFSLRLMRVEGGLLEPVGDLEDLHVDREGNLNFVVRSELLSEGSYLIRATMRDTQQAQEFLLRVVGDSY